MTVFLSDGGCSPRIRATSSSFWALWSLDNVRALNEPSSSCTPRTARASPALAINLQKLRKKKKIHFSGALFETRKTCMYFVSCITHTGLIHRHEPHRLLLQRRPLSEPSSEGKHLDRQPEWQNTTVNLHSGLIQTLLLILSLAAHVEIMHALNFYAKCLLKYHTVLPVKWQIKFSFTLILHRAVLKLGAYVKRGNWDTWKKLKEPYNGNFSYLKLAKCRWVKETEARCREWLGWGQHSPRAYFTRWTCWVKSRFYSTILKIWLTYYNKMF